jgi:hypothetical protein
MLAGPPPRTMIAALPITADAALRPEKAVPSSCRIV